MNNTIEFTAVDIIKRIITREDFVCVLYLVETHEGPITRLLSTRNVTLFICNNSEMIMAWPDMVWWLPQPV